ncbi:anaerobic ribonucleoside-triphosphate reductase [Macrococcoides caseolyticum]|uniref:anaerobic ribonucleoside-triphosphate reductase n=1 Tax=Macrococcoides caseolyticum TaxID=69966 RepID=UPI001F23F1EF|nr:anaerobic ribonucleoside-triphosphate reductase [Macrococcus caseolyticus]MCE4957778.1 anaerobic ribonucleoside-triphosphate reductase [Macrococcus caseolyticus]
MLQKNDLKERLEQLMNKSPEIVHENANKDANVFNTMRDLTAGTVAKSLGLEMLPEHIRLAHLNGDIHFHDLDYHPYMPMTNCCLIDIPGMLKDGFKIGNATVASPKSIQTAAAQIAQIIANVASSQYGGCSVDRIDEVLSPYAQMNAQKHRKIAEEYIPEHARASYIQQMTEKDIKDAIQSLEYEINTLYTSNGQTPFVTFGFGLGLDEYSVIIQRAILNTRINGLGTEHATAIFPKLVFSLKEGVNLRPTDPNYDIKQLALQCATKRMYPDVLNYKALTEIIGDFKAPMGCRSFLNRYKENGEFINNGRFNLGVVTLNLPRIALIHATPDSFMQALHQKLDLLRDACLFRINRLKEANPENAPILYQHGAFGKKLAANDDISILFTGRRSTISMGYIGLYEVGAHLFHKNWETDDAAKQFILNILKTIKAYADKLTEIHDIQFSVYGTPSESLTDRFSRLDTERFGEVENVTDKGYYTNSFHYDIRKKVTPFEKIDFEQPFAQYSTGGFIHYCEYPSLIHNPEALEAVWDYAYTRVGYLGTNTPIDQCFECGFHGEFTPTASGYTCPKCGNHDPETTDVVKRTCGYLGQPLKRPMVKGRRIEIATRVKHMSTRDDLL